MNRFEKVRALTGSRSYFKYDVDWGLCRQFFKEFPDFFSPQEQQYVELRRTSDLPLGQIRQKMGKNGEGISSRTLWDVQKLLFWKYHYILYVSIMDILDVVVDGQIPPIPGDLTAK